MDYERFGDRVEAHLTYVLARSGEEALSVLERRFSDGSWRTAPEAFINAFRILAERPGCDRSRMVTLADAVVGAVVSGPIDAVAHRVLAELLVQRELSDAKAHALVEWFLARAEAGDASLAADVLQRVITARNGATRLAVPLAEWLIQKGDAELRTRRRAGLGLEVVSLLHQYGGREWLLAAVRYVLDNDARLSASAPETAQLLAAVEALLEEQRVGVHLIRDLACAFSDVEAARLFARILGSTDAVPKVPLVRAAIVDALAAGLIAGPIALRAWKAAFLGTSPPADLRFASPAARHSALRALADLALWGPDQGRDEAPPAPLSGWFHLFAKAAVVTNGADFWLDSASAASLRRSLDGWGGRPATRGIREGIIDALNTAAALTESAVLAREILEDGGAVAAALQVLAQVLQSVEQPPSGFEESTREFVDHWLRSLETAPPVEFGELLTAVRSSRLAELDGEDKVRIEGTELLINERDLKSLGSAALATDDLVAAGVLYVVHEVIHLIQGIGEKRRVDELRATGAETTLMHLDLAADHLAAIVLSSAFPQWSLLYMKDLEGRAAVAFPTRPFHTAASRARKAHRLVGLRLDVHARRAGLLASDADEYVFGDYGPAGPSLAVLASGPPLRLIGTCPLSPKDAEVLYTAADHGAEGLSAIDDVLRHALANLRQPDRRD